MTVYIDIVLLENLCMDFIILFATAYIIKIQVKTLRIFVSSFIGAAYAVLVYVNILDIYTNIIMKIILSVCMVYIAYKPRSLKGMLKELILFYLVSFALGGCAFALLYIVKPQEILIKNGVYIGTYPIKIALLGGVVGFVITYIGIKTVKNKIGKDEIIYIAQIKINNETVNTKLLLDTGNMLKDPLTNSPVVLVEKKILANLLPEELIRLMEKNDGGEINGILDEYKKRIRIIPFSSVGKQNGMMLGVKADEIKIITDIDEIINKDAIICIYNKSFSKTNKYFGLIGLDLLERDVIKDEYFSNAKKQY